MCVGRGGGGVGYTLPCVCVCLSRKVNYLNMKGSLLDQHTIRGLNSRGKEVCRDDRNITVLPESLTRVNPQISASAVLFCAGDRDGQEHRDSHWRTSKIPPGRECVFNLDVCACVF